MRTLLKVSAIPVPTLFLSTAAVAQTGESAAAVPGEVVHRSYALQDEWQRLRNAAASQSASILAEIEIASDGIAAQQLGFLERFS
jgi:hypothetical protein